MPSNLPTPTVEELRQAFHDGVRALDKRSDRESGAVYDIIGGTTALLWVDQATRDRDLARSKQFNSATGPELTRRVREIDGVERYEDTRGSGTARLKRTTTGAGTIYEGTRILVARGTASAYYRTTETKVVASSDKIVTIAVECVDFGPTGAFDTATAMGANVLITDPCFDTFTVESMQVAPGTVYERDDELRARALATRSKRRVGMYSRIVQTCAEAGAATVALFPSSATGPDSDFGLSAVYVADAGASASDALIRRIVLALESIRVCGADLWVGKLTRSPLSISANVSLWGDLGMFDTRALQVDLVSALLDEFSGVNGGYGYRRSSLAGAMQKRSPDVKDVTFATPSADASIFVGTPASFPATLTRYVPRSTDIQLSFTGS
jgi:hypothetical protein